MRTPEQQAHLDWHNKRLLEAWGCTTPDEARPRFEAVKNFAKSEYGWTEEEARSVEDHRLWLLAEKAMHEAEAQDTLRRYQRGELQPPPPPPTMKQYIDSAGDDDHRKAELVSYLIDTSAYDARQAQLDRLARAQGIQGW